MVSDKENKMQRGMYVLEFGKPGYNQWHIKEKETNTIVHTFDMIPGLEDEIRIDMNNMLRQVNAGNPFYVDKYYPDDSPVRETYYGVYDIRTGDVAINDGMEIYHDELNAINSAQELNKLIEPITSYSLQEHINF